MRLPADQPDRDATSAAAPPEPPRARRRAIGPFALLASALSVTALVVGVLVVDANTPDPLPVHEEGGITVTVAGVPVDQLDAAAKAKVAEEIEAGKQRLADAKAKLGDAWSKLHEKRDDEIRAQAAEALAAADAVVAPNRRPEPASEADATAEATHESKLFGVSIQLGGTHFVDAPRPAWVATLETAVFVLVIGGAAAGTLLGLVSQFRGEHPAWGMAAQTIGTGVIGFVVLAIYVSMLVAIVAAATAVLVVVVALQVFVNSFDLPGVDITIDLPSI